MKIKREKLLNDLQDFAMRGNGVIIGSPGVGKTYLLKELYQSLESLEIPGLILPIDQLGDGTDKTLRKELSYRGDLIERLKSVPVSSTKAVLLFDAFDAARNEQTRNRFLKLIQRAIHELKESWNIIVTVRTYDATKSQELLDLFGNPNVTEHQSEEILCRHFTIPPFNEDEIRQALDQIGCPQYIYNDDYSEFKKILANPFNLWLLEKILKSLPDMELSTLSQIRSEVQLLDLFWQRRIETTDNEIDRLIVLEGIANKMVEQCSLSVKQSDIRETLIQTAWNDLQSDEILTKAASTGQRIAFSHNILFDYAISRLLIDDEPQNLEKFILEDASRPLFLRPSLTYFFTRLWYYKDPANFWKAFWHIFPNDQSVHLRLVARLIPTSVIANEACKIEQLMPLLEKLKNGGEIAKEAITRLLQSLQTLQIERDPLWINFFDQVSQHLHSDFAWDLANLTSDILERVPKTETPIIDACGRIGRRLLKWVWEERKTSESNWYDRFGGHWAVPLVAKTYHTDVEESRLLLKQVLQLTNEDNFPISFLSRLTEHVNKIWDCDPEFVVSIYHTVFAHEFNSEGETQRGGFVLSITTYRSQDFGICQYRLVKHLHNFLQKVPLDATKAVIQIVNAFVIRTHLIKDSREDVVPEDLISTFNFRGKSTYFMEDGSYIWDARNASDEPIEMADTLFEFIEELAISDEHLPLLESLLDIFRDLGGVAFFWKRLLKTAVQFPKVFAPRLFELCIAKPIQMHSETLYELCLFLKAAAADFTPNKLLQIEKSILVLSSEARDKNHRSVLEEDRNRLLAQIPVDLLRTDEAKRIRKEMERENHIPENRPPVRFRTWSEPVTEERWLQRQGVDTTLPENQELQRFSEDLNKFSSDWRNDDPTQEAVELILPRLQEVYTALKDDDTEADQKVINLLWRNLTDCVAIIARIANNLESDSFAFCRQVLLEGAEHEQPKPDPEHDAQFDHSGYSPFPRHEAVKGLLRFAFHQPDAEILDAIEILAEDPVPSVRMVTAIELANVYIKAPDRFWRIIDNRAVHERNRVVQEYLYFTLNRVARKENEAKVTHVMTKLLEHTPLPPGKQGLSDPFMGLLIWLALERENPWALRIIKDRFFKDPIQYANILTRAVNAVMKDYIVPKYLETPDGRERTKRSIEWLEKVINVISNKIKELYDIKEHETENGVKKLHSIYTVIDAVITRLYYEVAHGKNQSEKQAKEISLEFYCEFYNEVKPLMKQVVAFAQNPVYGLMFAPTAHYFMQVLKSFLRYNPKEVLHLAAGVVKSSEKFGYTLDTLAVMEVVEFVEIVLADYRHVVRDGEALEDLLNLLDLFAKIGWSDALKLVWRLDEVFR